MTAATPDRALHPLLDAIIARVDDAVVDALGIARLERDLAKLWKASAVSTSEYHMTRAMLAMLKHNNDAAVEAAREAVRWSAGDFVVQNNCLTVMSTALEVSEAVDLMHGIIRRNADNIEVVRDLIVKASDLLQFCTASDLIDRFEKLNVNCDSEPKLLRRIIVRTKDAMTQQGFTDDDFTRRLIVARDIVRNKGFNIWRSSRTTLSDGTFMYFIHVDADSDRCAELSFDVADALVEAFEDPGSELATIACRPALDLVNMKQVTPEQL
jgi:hypothetical protein